MELKMGRRKKEEAAVVSSPVTYVAEGELVKDIVDFDEYAKKKHEENKKMSENDWKKKWIDLGGVVIDENSFGKVWFKSKEFDVTIYKSGDVTISDGSQEVVFYERTHDQIINALKLVDFMA
jgi:hypothetical protein